MSDKVIIDRQVLEDITDWEKDWGQPFGEFLEDFTTPLVLCGECKWIYYDIAEKSYWCTKCRYTPRWQQTDPTHFCKDGVKA